MTHCWYCDLTPDRRFSRDPESLLVWLCADWASRLEAQGLVQFAGADGLCDVPCWQYGAPVADTERKRR
jgi:hypothetical protein